MALIDPRQRKGRILFIGRRKEPILCYKNNLVLKGLKKIKISKLH